MKELVVISGKGGTGKTSAAAAFASLAASKVLADCDVDAADLHLILGPEVRSRHEFRSGNEAVIQSEACIGCGVCFEHCRFGAVIQLAGPDASWIPAQPDRDCAECDFCTRSCPTKSLDLIQAMHGSCTGLDSPLFEIDPLACEGCGVCVDLCPVKAISFPERLAGEWFISDTRHGPMIHARLGAAAENSGKLVSLVRQQARELALQSGKDLILVDGPPGIGCPVIASITGASMLLIVTEPTLSGRHDLQRVAELARHFRVPAAVCVNKWDINPDLTEQIEAFSDSMGMKTMGRIHYDIAVTQAQVEGKTVFEIAEGKAARDIRALWANLTSALAQL